MLKASLVFTTGFCGKTVTLKDALTFCAAWVRNCESRQKLFLLTFVKQWIRKAERMCQDKCDTGPLKQCTKKKKSRSRVLYIH